MDTDFLCTQALGEDLDETCEEDGEEKEEVGVLKIVPNKKVGMPAMEFPLYRGENIIGQHTNCSICIPWSIALSKKHAVIEADSNTCFLLDFGSSNKTRLGKVKLKPNVRYGLRDNDEIVFGDVKSIFVQKHNENAVSDSSFVCPTTPVTPSTSKLNGIEKTQAANCPSTTSTPLGAEQRLLAADTPDNVSVITTGRSGSLNHSTATIPESQPMTLETPASEKPETRSETTLAPPSDLPLPFELDETISDDELVNATKQFAENEASTSTLAKVSENVVEADSDQDTDYHMDSDTDIEDNEDPAHTKVGSDKSDAADLYEADTIEITSAENSEQTKNITNDESEEEEEMSLLRNVDSEQTQAYILQPLKDDMGSRRSEKTDGNHVSDSETDDDEAILSVELNTLSEEEVDAAIKEEERQEENPTSNQETQDSSEKPGRSKIADAPSLEDSPIISDSFDDICTQGFSRVMFKEENESLYKDEDPVLGGTNEDPSHADTLDMMETQAFGSVVQNQEDINKQEEENVSEDEEDIEDSLLFSMATQAFPKPQTFIADSGSSDNDNIGVTSAGEDEDVAASVTNSHQEEKQEDENLAGSFENQSEIEPKIEQRNELRDFTPPLDVDSGASVHPSLQVNGDDMMEDTEPMNTEAFSNKPASPEKMTDGAPALIRTRDCTIPLSLYSDQVDEEPKEQPDVAGIDDKEHGGLDLDKDRSVSSEEAEELTPPLSVDSEVNGDELMEETEPMNTEAFSDKPVSPVKVTDEAPALVRIRDCATPLSTYSDDPSTAQGIDSIQEDNEGPPDDEATQCYIMDVNISNSNESLMEEKVKNLDEDSRTTSDQRDEPDLGGIDDEESGCLVLDKDSSLSSEDLEKSKVTLAIPSASEDAECTQSYIATNRMLDADPGRKNASAGSESSITDSNVDNKGNSTQHHPEMDNLTDDEDVHVENEDAASEKEDVTDTLLVKKSKAVPLQDNNKPESTCNQDDIKATQAYINRPDGVASSSIKVELEDCIKSSKTEPETDDVEATQAYINLPSSMQAGYYEGVESSSTTKEASTSRMLTNGQEETQVAIRMPLSATGLDSKYNSSTSHSDNVKHPKEATSIRDAVSSSLPESADITAGEDCKTRRSTRRRKAPASKSKEDKRKLASTSQGSEVEPRRSRRISRKKDSDTKTQGEDDNDSNDSQQPETSSRRKRLSVAKKREEDEASSVEVKEEPTSEQNLQPPTRRMTRSRSGEKRKAVTKVKEEVGSDYSERGTSNNSDTSNMSDTSGTRTGRRKRKKSSLSSSGSATSAKGPQTPAKKVKAEESTSEELERTVSLALRPRREKPKVMFTGVMDNAGEQIVHDLGGKMTSNIHECTHLVTDKMRRTIKFLCAVVRGINIVTPNWLHLSKVQGKFLPEEEFELTEDTCTPDGESLEKKYNFSLQNSLEMARERSDRLFVGLQIFVTKNVVPPPEQMCQILKCAGAMVLPKIPHHLDSSSPTTVVIASAKDKRTCLSAIKAGCHVVSSEFVLTGVLQQRVDFDTHALFGSNAQPQQQDTSVLDHTVAGPGSSRTRKRNSGGGNVGTADMTGTGEPIESRPERNQTPAQPTRTSTRKRKKKIW